MTHMRIIRHRLIQRLTPKKIANTIQWILIISNKSITWVKNAFYFLPNAKLTHGSLASAVGSKTV